MALCAVAISSMAAWRYEKLADYHWREWAGRIRADEKVVVPVNPAGFSFQYPGKHRQ